MYSFGSTSCLFLFLYHLVSMIRITQQDICAITNSNVYQNPQLVAPLLQMDSFLLNGMDTTNQTAPEKNAKLRPIPTISPFMKYGTCAKRNSNDPR